MKTSSLKTNFKAWLSAATAKLEHSGIGTARLDSLVLLADELKRDKAWILAHPETELTGAQAENLAKKLVRRSGHEPLSYIRRRSEFYGREFSVTSAVLQPRPESETMIDMLGQLSLPKNPVFVDVGTGCGALAITAKLELPKSQVIAIDIDPLCLKIARQNARKHRVEIKFQQGNLLDLVLSAPHIDVILANLPYIPDGWQISEAAGREPRLAIFGGGDGLLLYRAIFKQLSEISTPPRFVLTESMPPQHKKLRAIAQKSDYLAKDEQDFIQLFQK